MKQANSSLSYIKELDSIRAIAVLMVMFSHYMSQFRFSGVVGSCGVLFFFVLSGYLITKILLSEKQKIDSTGPELRKTQLWDSIRIFYIRRSLRIFPIYYLTLGVLVVCNIDSVREYFFSYFFYLSNFVYSFDLGFDRLSHFWSLAVEEQFYLFWPFLILLIPSSRLNVSFFLFLVCCSLLFRLLMIHYFSVESQSSQLLMPSCVDSFALGAIIVLIEKKTISKKWMYLLLVLSLLIFVATQGFSNSSVKFISTLFGKTVFSVFSFALLTLIVKQMLPAFVMAFFRNRVLVFLGKVSYGIYIYHMFVPGVIAYCLDAIGVDLSGKGLLMPMNFIVTFLVAYVSYKLVETPINNLKQRFSYKRKLSVNGVAIQQPESA